MGDAGVRDTNADACVKKAACVAKGYWEDPFVGLFAKGRHPHDAPNSPLINRGYWARVSAIWTVVTNFLRAFGGRGPQVLSIGAGWDTLYFRLRSQGLVPHSCVWVEVDFPEVTRRKCEVLAKHADLQRLLPRPEDLRCSATEVVSPAYSVLAADLREAGPLVQRLREAAGLRGSRPVLLVSECVLVYMAPAESDALLRAVAGAFPDLTVVAYEAVGPDDAFGRMMVSNLEARGCPFRGIHAYPSIAAQEKRYQALHMMRTVVLDMNAVYAKLSETERKRIQRLEMLDEMEEWCMILSHYCLVMATVHEDPLCPSFL